MPHASMGKAPVIIRRQDKAITAIPTFGGMLVALMMLFVVPVGFCRVQEWKPKLGGQHKVQQ